MFHNPEQTDSYEQNGANGHPVPQEVERQVALLLSGSGKPVGQEILADPELMAEERLRLGFIDSDPEGIAHLDREQRYLLNDVPRSELVEELLTDPSSYPGAELLGDPQVLWENQGASDNANRGSPYGDRIWGLVDLWYHIARIFALLMIFLMGLVRDLNKVEDPDQEPISRNSQPKNRGKIWIRVSFFLSACGGTGSAICLYLVDLFNYLTRGLSGIHRVEFEAHIMLPGLFLARTADPQALLAKTYAFFDELRARYSRWFGPLQLAQLWLSRARRPFCWMYIYDTVNAEGLVFASRQQVAQVIKQVWQVINFGPIAPVYRGLLERVRAEPPYNFSAAGVYVLELPLERMIRQLAHWLALEHLDQHFLHAVPEAEAQAWREARLADFLNRQPALRELPAFNIDRSDRPVRVNIVRQFEKLARKDIPQAVDHYRLEQPPAWRADFEQQALAAAQKRSQLIAAELEAIVNQPGGLDLAGYFLHDLDAFLAGQYRMLTQALERVQEELAQHRQRLEQRQSKTKRWSLRPRQAYLQRYQTLLSSELQVERMTARLTYLNQLRQQLAGLKQQLHNWQTTLRALQDRLQAGETELVRQAATQRSVVVEPVIDDQDTAALYEAGKDNALTMIVEGLQLQWRATKGEWVLLYTVEDNQNHRQRWQVLSDEGLSAHLRYCRHPWARLNQLSLEHVLAERGVKPEQLAADLERKAAPLVAISEVKHIPAEAHLLLLGSEKGEAGYWKGYVGKAGALNIVATGDKNRLVFLYTVHGIDVFKLRQSPSWLRARDQAIAEGRPLYVVPELDPLRPDNQAQAAEEESTPPAAVDEDPTPEQEVTHVAEPQ